MKRFHARHRLDIGPRGLAAAFAALPASDPERAAAGVEHLWSADATGLACYSVRSAFHLLLTSLDLPAGSEVMFSAVTHPDMPRIAIHHGLVPIPVDLDVATLAPHPEELLRAVSPGTRMVVVAHLFGGRVDLRPIVDVCRRNGLLLVEDCAQAFRGLPHVGDPLADVSMFSFGILKTATALGGAMLSVRHPALLARMRACHQGWPLQGRSSHLKRTVQTAAFVALTRPLPYTVLARVIPSLGADFDHFVNSAARAFPAASTMELVERLEQRPGAPLLKLMAHRLGNFDRSRLLARAASGERLASMLPVGLHVGGLAPDHTHWLFPVACDRPDELIRAARLAGFDAARSASSVKPVPAPAGRPDLEARCAQDLMSRLVFLPAYPELPEGSLEALASAVEGHQNHAYASS